MRRGPEQGVYEACCDLLRACGFLYWRLSQARASQQSPGLGDLFAIHIGYRLIVWIETKARHGKLSVDQRIFRQAILDAGGLYVSPRSPDDLADYLRLMGVPVTITAGRRT